ncbi:MAG: hypothetical protein ABSF23_11260 [Terracidiphilus sp.]|jgi:hypothetical protein
MDIIIWVALVAALTYAVWAGDQLKAIRRELEALREKMGKK